MNEEIPVERTDDGRCPDCGAGMLPTNPWDPDCDVLYCGECGFNDPEDDPDA